MLAKLNSPPQIADNTFSFTAPQNLIELSVPEPELASYVQLLERLDGSRTVDEAIAGVPDADGARAFIGALDTHGLLDDRTQVSAPTGIECLFELEDLANELLHQTLYQNRFWKGCMAAKSRADLPPNVMHGLVIENYHFLFRESYFDAPVLSYVPNTGARLAMNAFFAEEYGHDEILLKSLQFLGINREQLAATAPLPETMALCNALAFWSHTDPLFFFTTLGILEGKDRKEDSFIEAAMRVGMEPEFIGPVRQHAAINLKGNHGSLTRELFHHIPAISAADLARMRSLTHLFVELYDQFYTGVWDYYSSSRPLLRHLDSPAFLGGKA